MIVVAIIMFAFGFCIGILSGFDWQAYFKYKKEITELVMKYKKGGKE